MSAFARRRAAIMLLAAAPLLGGSGTVQADGGPGHVISGCGAGEAGVICVNASDNYPPLGYVGVATIFNRVNALGGVVTVSLDCFWIVPFGLTHTFYTAGNGTDFQRWSFEVADTVTGFDTLRAQTAAEGLGPCGTDPYWSIYAVGQVTIIRPPVGG